MSGDYEFDRLLEEFGIAADDFSAHDNSGMERGDFYATDPSMPEFDGQKEMGNYREDVVVPATLTPNLYQRPESQLNRYNDQHDNDKESYDLSDSFSYVPSSPTPNHSRGQAAPAIRQLTERTAGYPPQKSYITGGVENNGQGHAYKQHRYGNAPARGTTSTIYEPSIRPSELSASKHGQNTRNIHGIRLRPVSELPDIYRGIFKFVVFNAIQSKCYQTIMETKENMVVSAPTGGGKTVLFELGLIDVLKSAGNQSDFKCVYVAPTKALCSERTRDWTAKFEPLGIQCCEMTGDTIEMGKSAWSAARKAKIIITTSEKWDSLTRGGHDHGDLLSQIRLFLVDEVHVLNESRGSTLEVVISRMKTRSQNIRFILVSATVPNIQDIANWIGNPTLGSNPSATVYEFGEEYRPCKITRHVYGYSRKSQNDFQFARTLDYKLFAIIQQHACSKPILVFCSTRKGVVATAEQLLKEYEEAVASRQSTPWTPPRHLDRTFHDKKLEKLAKSGLGVHHAGLTLDDRRTTEDLYLDGSLRVICATSTLAVGVNLPAHTVVIKGVKLYMGNAWQEYSDLDMIQMIGRAGRPQFDKEGVAIILCEQELENKYRNLAQGTTILESSLHENLLEHINSEIGIGAIKDIQSAKGWLRNSFLRQRIQKNPGRYHIGKTAGQTWEEKMDDMVLQAVKKLEANELITLRGGGINAELRVTDYGDIMSRYYIRQLTMGRILKLNERPSAREILEVISCAEELGDVRLRGGDKQVYNRMKDHPDIRFKIKKVEKASDKSFVLIQAVLGGISLSVPEYKTSDSQPALDALSIFRHTARIARVVVEVAIIKKNGAQLKHGLELVRCLTAKAWEDRPVVLKQIESIGEKSLKACLCVLRLDLLLNVLKVLAEHGITSLHTLRKQEPSRIEVLLNRRPPYGHDVLQFVRDMPQYALSVTVARNGIVSYAGKKPVSIELNIECQLAQELSGLRKLKQKSRSLGMTSILTTTSDSDFIDFRRISTKVLKDARSFTVTAELTKPSQSICVYVSPDNFAGLTVSQVYRPSVPAKEYPTMDTHPKTSDELLLEAFDQDPGFWEDFGPEDDDDRPEDKQCPNNTPGTKPTLSSETKVLPNGNYVCNHACKDKNTCRHICCREGTTKPPPRPKRVAGEKFGTHGSSIATGRSPMSKAKKKTVMEDKRIVELESLRKRTGTGGSICLTEGKRFKLETVILDRKHKSVIKPRFDVHFAELGDEIVEKQDGADDLPDAKELLASIQKKDVTVDPSPDNSFSNSELDAIMLTIDTTEISPASPDKFFAKSPSRCDPPIPPSKRRQREQPDAQLATSPLSPTLNEHAMKRTKLTDTPITQPDNEPLFLYNSSFSMSSCPKSNPIPDTFDSGELERHTNEDYFTLDNSIFDIIPSNSNENTRPKSVEGPTLNTELGGNETVRNGAESIAPNMDEEYYDYGPDEWAEIEDWILNSRSVQLAD